MLYYVGERKEEENEGGTRGKREGKLQKAPPVCYQVTSPSVPALRGGLSNILSAPKKHSFWRPIVFIKYCLNNYYFAKF